MDILDKLETGHIRLICCCKSKRRAHIQIQTHKMYTVHQIPQVRTHIDVNALDLYAATNLTGLLLMKEGCKDII